MYLKTRPPSSLCGSKWGLGTRLLNQKQTKAVYPSTSLLGNVLEHVLRVTVSDLLSHLRGQDDGQVVRTHLVDVFMFSCMVDVRKS